MTFTIYPAIDLRNGQVVRLRQGDPEKQTAYSSDPAQIAQKWADAGARWLHLINLDGEMRAHAGCISSILMEHSAKIPKQITLLSRKLSQRAEIIYPRNWAVASVPSPTSKMPLRSASPALFWAHLFSKILLLQRRRLANLEATESFSVWMRGMASSWRVDGKTPRIAPSLNLLRSWPTSAR